MTDSINSIGSIEIQKQESIRKIPVDQVLFQDKSKIDDIDDIYVIPERTSKAGLRKQIYESKNQQNILNISNQIDKHDDDFYKMVEICRKDRNGSSAISYAIKIGRADIAKYFHRMGDVFETQHLWDAIVAENVEMVDYLIKNNVHVYGIKTIAHFCEKAISGGNEKIIDLILKDCNERGLEYDFFRLFKSIRDFQNPQLMRTWLEKYIFLRKGEYLEISDETIHLFLSSSLKKEIENKNFENINQFLQCGWFISPEEITLAIESKDEEMIDLMYEKGSFAHFDNQEIFHWQSKFPKKMYSTDLTEFDLYPNRLELYLKNGLEHRFFEYFDSDPKWCFFTISYMRRIDILEKLYSDNRITYDEYEKFIWGKLYGRAVFWERPFLDYGFKAILDNRLKIDNLVSLIPSWRGRIEEFICNSNLSEDLILRAYGKNSMADVFLASTNREFLQYLLSDKFSYEQDQLDNMYKHAYNIGQYNLLEIIEAKIQQG